MDWEKRRQKLNEQNKIANSSDDGDLSFFEKRRQQLESGELQRKRQQKEQTKIDLQRTLRQNASTKNNALAQQQRVKQEKEDAAAADNVNRIKSQLDDINSQLAAEGVKWAGVKYTGRDKSTTNSLAKQKAELEKQLKEAGLRLDEAEQRKRQKNLSAMQRELAKKTSKYGGYSSEINDKEANPYYRAVNRLPRIAFGLDYSNIYGTLSDIDHTQRKQMSYMTDEERNTYNYIFDTEGAEPAREYFMSLRYELADRQYESSTTKGKEFADELPVIGTAASVVGKMGGDIAGGISFYANKILRDTGYNDDSLPMNYREYFSGSSWSNAVQEQVNENIDNPVGQFFYGTGVSIANNALRNLVLAPFGTGAVLGAMALEVAGSSVNEALSMGATEEQAALYGALSATGEVIFEKMPLEHLLKMKDAHTGKQIIKEVLKQSGMEFTEEALTTVWNTLVSDEALGKMGTYERTKAAYIEQGMTEEEAEKQASMDIFKQVLLDGLGGAISGVAMGGGSIAINKIFNSVNGKNAENKALNEITGDIRQSNETSTAVETETNYSTTAKENKNLRGKILSKGLNAEENSQIHKTATEIKNKLDTGKTVTAEEWKGFIKNVQAEYSLNETKNAIKKAAEKSGEAIAESDLDTMAAGLEKSFKGKLMTDAEDRLVRSSSAAKAAYSELTMLDYDTGEIVTEAVEKNFSAEAQSIKAKADNAEAKKIKSFAEGQSEEYKNALSGSYKAYLSIVEHADKENKIVYSKLNAEDYAEFYNAFYEIGKKGTASMQTLREAYKKIGDAALDSLAVAYNAGRSDSKKQQTKDAKTKQAERNEQKKAQQTADKKRAVKRVGIERSITAEELNSPAAKKAGAKAVNMKRSFSQKQRAAITFLRSVAQNTGINIVLYETDKGNGANGWYDSETNTIYLDIFSGYKGEQALLRTFSHELTHYMQEQSPESYTEYKNFLLDYYYGKDGGVTLERLLEQERRLAPKKDRAYWEDEIAANASEMFVNDERAMKTLIGKHAGAAKTVDQWFKQMTYALRRAFKGVNATEEAAKELQANVKYFEDAQKRWNKLLEESIENSQGSATSEESKTAEESAKSNASFSLRNEFANEVDRWYINGRTNDESFILGSTGDVLQGLGAIESDIYLNGDKINTILETHPEMTIDEIKMIGQIIENPAIVLKSKNAKRKGRPNTRLVMFGNIKAQNGKPVLAVLDLKPVEKNLVINDMQKISSAYTKTNDPIGFIEQSTVVYLDKKRATKVLRAIGFQMPIALADSGFIGSITYSRNNVNISGEDFRNVVDTGIQFSMRKPIEETRDLIAVHNISESKLESTLKLGGFPMPSIAIVKAEQGHSEFGDISVVFGKDTIDPEFIKSNEVYGADAGERLDSIAQRIKSVNENGFIALDNAYENIADAVRSRKTKSGILKYLQQYGMDATMRDVDEIVSLVADIAEMPTQYFEAKPRRAVGFDEVKAVVLPNTVSEKLKQSLSDAGINFVEYSAGNSESRLDALNSLENVKFSKRKANWKPTLDKTEWTVVNSVLRNQSGDKLTETTDYFFREEKGKTVFGIYSTDDSTLLYAVHGKQAHEEYRFVTAVREEIKNGTYRGTKSVDIFLETKGMHRDRNTDDDGSASASGRRDGNAYLYAGQSGRYPGRALQNVLENITQEGRDRGVSGGRGRGVRGGNGRERILTVSDLEKVQYQLRKDDENRLGILGRQEERLTEDLKTLEKAYGEVIRKEYEENIKPNEEMSKRAAEINRKAAKRFMNEVGATAHMANDDRLTYLLPIINEIIDKGPTISDSEGLTEKLYRTAYEHSSEYIVDANSGQYKELRDYVKNTAVFVDAGTRADVGDYGSFVKHNAGRLRLTNDPTALGLDEFYDELRSIAPDMFSDTTDGAEQLYELSAFMQNAGVTESIGNFMTEDEFVQYATDGTSDLGSEMNLLFDRTVGSFLSEANRKERERSRANEINRAMGNVISAAKHYEQAQDYARAEGYLAGEIEATAKATRKIEQLKSSREHQALNYERRLQAYRDKLAEVKSKRDAVLKERQAAFAEQRREAIERPKRQQLRKRIAKTVKQLNTMLLNPSDAKHIPPELSKAVTGFLDIFTDDTSVFKREKLIELKEAYSAISKAESDLTELYDEDIAELLDELKNTVINGRRLSELSLDELNRVDSITKHFVHLVKDQNKLFIDNKRMEINSIVNMTVDAAEKHGYKEYRGGALGEAAKKADAYFNYSNVTPVYFFKRIGGGMEVLFDDMLYNGQLTYAKDINEAQQFMQGIFKQYGVWDWSSKNQSNKKDKNYFLEFTTEQGFKLKLTRNEALSVYATYKRGMANGDGAAHLMQGGIVMKPKAEESFKTKYRENAKGNPLSVKDLNTIFSFLTEEQKECANKIVEYLSITDGGKRKETSMQLYGYNKFTESYYFPYKVASDFIKSEPGGEISETGAAASTRTTRIKNMGSTKATKRKANQAIVVEDFFDVVAKSMEETAKYHAFAVPQDNFMRVLNYKDTVGLEGSTSVKQVIRDSYGTEGVKYIYSFMGDIFGGAVQIDESNVVKSLFGKFKKTAVAANLSVAVQQPSAIMRATALIDPKYLTKTVGQKNILESMYDYSSTAFLKNMGRFDIGTGYTSEQYILKPELKGKEYLKQLTATGEYDTGARDDLTGYLSEKADWITWGHLMNAVIAETENTTRYEKDTEEFKKAAGRRFDEIVNATQVYDSVLAKSPIMRSKSTMVQTLSAFMNEPTLSYNMVLDGIINRKTDKEYAARTICAFVASVVANALLKSIIGAMRDDDEDKTYLEKYVEKFIGNTLGDINPFTNLPIISQIADVLQGYTIEDQSFGMLSDTVNAFKNAFKKVAKEDYLGALEDLTIVFNLFGLPVRNIYRDMSAIFTTVFDTEPLKNTSLDGMFDAAKDGVLDASFGYGFGKNMGWIDTSKAAGIKRAMKNGSSADISRETKKAIAAYTAEGKSEQAAKGYIKTAMTNYWKPIYIKASSKKQAEIRQALYATGLYKDASTVVKMCREWTEDEKMK